MWCCVVVAVPVVFEVLWMVGVIGYEVVRGVVVLAGMGRGPQCTLDRGQKPLVVTGRQQQVVQDLLVRLALLEAATQRTVASPGATTGSCLDSSFSLSSPFSFSFRSFASARQGSTFLPVIRLGLYAATVTWVLFGYPEGRSGN